MSTEENNPLGLANISVTKNLMELSERFLKLCDTTEAAIKNVKNIGRGMLINILRVESLQTTVDLHEERINILTDKVRDLETHHSDI